MNHYKSICFCGKKEKFSYEFAHCKKCKLVCYCSIECLKNDVYHNKTLCERFQNNDNFFQYLFAFYNKKMQISLLDKLLMDSREFFIKNGFNNPKINRQIVICKIKFIQFEYYCLTDSDIEEYCKNNIFREKFEKSLNMFLVIIKDEKTKVTLFFLSNIIIPLK